jgi:ornithine cyclodeaminase
MRIVPHQDVVDTLDGREKQVVELVREAYRLHDQGRSAVPHSVFLRFPDNEIDRIIALPAYVGGERPSAGVKWISSFPGNLERGLERASAAILLNSMTTGHPEALIEASVISARRTGASAALAASLLMDEGPARMTLVGCGVINFEVLRYATVTLPALTTVTLHDRDPGRAEAFAARVAEVLPGLEVTIESDRARALGDADCVSLATTAIRPHLDLSEIRPGSVVLHVSLRDLTPEAVLAAHNVVDDADHVCREGTSLFLAEQQSGDRAFIDASIGALLNGRAVVRRRPESTVVFSPFGLGVLDIMLARFVLDDVVRRDAGTVVSGFVPA